MIRQMCNNTYAYEFKCVPVYVGAIVHLSFQEDLIQISSSPSNLGCNWLSFTLREIAYKLLPYLVVETFFSLPPSIFSQSPLLKHKKAKSSKEMKLFTATLR